MTVTRPAYCTREDVLRATDAVPSLRMLRLIDDSICEAADAVDAALQRVFYPRIATRYFDWPSWTFSGPSWRLELEANELVSLTTLTSGGTALSVADANLEPNDSGPPYDRIELDSSTTTAFGAGATLQRNVAVTGVFGYRLDSAPTGALAEALDTSETAVDVTDSSAVGVGDLLLCGTERMLVTDAAMLTTGQTLQTPVTDVSSVTTIAVTNGAAYAAGEVIQLDAELMEIQSVTGNNLTVDRATRGTVLASHTGSTIYAPRTLTVVRGYAGTTAATHLDASALTRHVYPSLVHGYALAEALVTLAQKSGGYARPAGSGSNTRPEPGAGLPAVRAAAIQAHGRTRGPGVV